MRKGLTWILGFWFFSAGQILAESLPEAKSKADGAPAPASPSSTNTDGDGRTGEIGASTSDGGACCPFWARPEYLLWWLKNRPLPVPLVTTGNPNVGFDPNSVNTINTAGALGQPGTQILLGGQNLNSVPFSGMRLTLGTWLDYDELFGIEGSGFVLERLTNLFTVSSDNTGRPPLYFPISTGAADGERGIPIADPLRGFSGSVGVNSSLRLWGAELNGIVNLSRTPAFEFTLLAGLRYADLRENLQIFNTTTDLIFNNVTNLTDLFDTRNQFYGGQVGSCVAVQHDRFSLSMTGKVALGSTHQVLNIQGAIAQVGPNPLVPPGLGTFPGGLFAEPSNIGQRSSNQFTVLPSLEVKLGYELTHRARLIVGYDIIYWNRVVRPGNQIDHNVNLSQNAVLDPNGSGTLVGPAKPVPLFNRGDFWAQGVNVGVEFRY